MSIDRQFWKKKKVLVTGHEGFLGSWLTKTLVGLQSNVIGVDKVLNRRYSILNGQRNGFKAVKGNINNKTFVEGLICQFRPQIIFHLAAEAIVDDSLKNPVKTFRTNIQGTWNILEVLRGKRFVEAVVVASSDKAYGEHKKLPYTEQAALNGKHPYDVSKSCADLLAQTYHHTYGVPVCITRCGNIYGPGDYHFSRIVPDVIRHALNEERFQIRSDGKYVRDYIYVEDIVLGYLTLAQKMKKLNLAGEAFNFSDEKPMTVLELYSKIIKRIRNKTVKPEILNYARNEIRKQYLSTRKSRTILNWRARHSLEEGLDKTIHWYRSNRVKTRN